MTADDPESPMNPSPRLGASHAHRRSQTRRYKTPHESRITEFAMNRNFGTRTGLATSIFVSHEATKARKGLKFSVMVFPPFLRGFVPSCAILFETPGIRLARAVVEYEVEH